MNLAYIFLACCACLGISAGIAVSARPWKKIEYDLNHMVFIYKGKINKLKGLMRRDEQARIFLFYWSSGIAVAAAVLIVWTLVKMAMR